MLLNMIPIRVIIVGIIVLFIGSGCASNYSNDGNIEVEQQVDQVVEQNNQLLELIEKVMLKQESQIEEERKQLIEIGDELNSVLEEVEELEKQLKDFPVEGDEIEYSELYAYYELKWNEYNSLYEAYDKKVEEFNILVEKYNTKYESLKSLSKVK